MTDFRTLPEKLEDAAYALILSGLVIGFFTGICIGQMLGAWGRE